MAALVAPDDTAFRQQIATARVLDRINTGVGFYTHVAVDRAKCRPLDVRYKTGALEVEGIEYGVIVILWDDEGYLDTIEGVSAADNAFEGRDLSTLKFVRAKPFGSAEHP